MKKYAALIISALFLAVACQSSRRTGPIKIAKNNRFFTDQAGKPFFWLGDTAWLLGTKLNRKQVDRYLKDRHQKGFTVIQMMVLPSVSSTNAYGDSALVNHNAAFPKVTSGKNPDDSAAYDYWDHIDYIVNKAKQEHLQMGLVAIWGENVKHGDVSRGQARKYARFLANRYSDAPNVIWINGGDTHGSDSTATWNIIGKTLDTVDGSHLITFHPFGRTMSSMWFHDAGWLDFNMFQSGHRRYDQDTTGLAFGEDNWRYVKLDYSKKPVKPTLDGEPSYEGIPEGLHDPSQPYWEAKDVRRYAYWSVLAGAAGFTYGNNAVMQMHQPGDEGAYGVKEYWYDAIDDPGAGQMRYLKQLMLSRSYFQRIPDSSLVANQCKRYDHLQATRGETYALIYTYNGRNMNINMGKIDGERVRAAWFNPRDGSKKEIGTFSNEGIHTFNPPGRKEEGNDWVLMLDSL